MRGQDLHIFVSFRATKLFLPINIFVNMEESSRLKGNVVRDESSSMHPKLRGKRRNDDSCGLLGNFSSTISSNF